MDWIGIGVIIIGIALLIIAFLLIKPLKKLTELLGNVQKTTDALPNQVAGIISSVSSTLSTGNNTLQQINEQLGALRPIFYIVENVGDTTQKLSSKAAGISEEMKNKPGQQDTVINRNNLEGMYGAMTLGYSFWQHRKNKGGSARLATYELD